LRYDNATTSESRHFIGLKEILGVEYECPTCRVRVYYALDKIPILQGFMCKGCGKNLIDAPDSEYIEQLVRTIRHLQSRGESLSMFRFQIPGETP